MTAPPHLKALHQLKKARVDFVIVGATAIDLFMPEMAAVYATRDCDILVRPRASDLARALKTLARSGYRFSVNGEPLLPDSLIIKRILEYRITTRAEAAGATPIDILVEAKGFRFETWWSHRRMFKVGGVALPCAALEHVLESKKQAGRKKDKALLQLVKATQGDPDKPSPAERKRFEAFRAKA